MKTLSEYDTYFCKQIKKRNKQQKNRILVRNKVILSYLLSEKIKESLVVQGCLNWERFEVCSNLKSMDSYDFVAFVVNLFALVFRAGSKIIVDKK